MDSYDIAYLCLTFKVEVLRIQIDSCKDIKIISIYQTRFLIGYIHSAMLEYHGRWIKRINKCEVHNMHDYYMNDLKTVLSVGVHVLIKCLLLKGQAVT